MFIVLAHCPPSLRVKNTFMKVCIVQSSLPFLQVSVASMEISRLLIQKLKDRFKPHIPTSMQYIRRALFGNDILELFPEKLSAGFGGCNTNLLF